VVRILVGSNLWITWSQIALDQPGPRRRREPPSNATSTPGSISLDALDLLIEERSDPGAKLILGKPEYLPSGVGPNREDWIARRFAMKEPTRRTPTDRPGRTRRIEATDRLYRRCGVTVSTGLEAERLALLVSTTA
jgi:hypothetical protein